MPRRATNIPGTKLWGRIDRFEVECPDCGHIISPYHGRLLTQTTRWAKTPAAAEKLRRTWKKVSERIFDPYTQRMRCAYCRKVYVIGLLVYPAPLGGIHKQPFDADTRKCLTPRQRLELRTMASPFYATQLLPDGSPRNVFVEFPCTCPPPPGWTGTCPIHGAFRPEQEGRKAPTAE